LTPLLFWILQKPNQIIDLLYIEQQKMKVMLLLLDWWQAAQSAQTLEILHHSYTLHDYL